MKTLDEFINTRPDEKRITDTGVEITKGKIERAKPKSGSKIGEKEQSSFMKTHSGLTKSGWSIKGQSVKNGVKRFHYKKGDKEKIVEL